MLPSSHRQNWRASYLGHYHLPSCSSGEYAALCALPAVACVADFMREDCTSPFQEIRLEQNV